MSVCTPGCLIQRYIFPDPLAVLQVSYPKWKPKLLEIMCQNYSLLLLVTAVSSAITFKDP